MLSVDLIFMCHIFTLIVCDLQWLCTISVSLNQISFPLSLRLSVQISGLYELCLYQMHM